MTDNKATGGAGGFRFGVVAPLTTDLPAWRDQVAALDHPHAFSALTLLSTRPVARPARSTTICPTTTRRLWRRCSRVRCRTGPTEPPLPPTPPTAPHCWVTTPEQARAVAARIWDRTPSNEPSVQQANQLGTVFAHLDCAPRWRERLPELTLPTLVVHGRTNPFFPVGNGEALAAAIHTARLLIFDDMGTALPDAVADEVAAAMLAR